MKRKLYDVPQISSVQEMLLRSAKVYSEKLALEDLNPTPINKVTYSQLLDYVLRFGTSLQNLGIEERTHIALIGENRVQWVISYLTCMLFNYVVVPIDRNLSENEVYNIIHESDAEAVIFSGAYSDLFTGSHPSLKRIEHFISMDQPSEDSEFKFMVDLINKTNPISENELPEVNPSKLAEIIFTSGSLGRAKGVMLSQKNIASNLVDMVSMLFIYPEDRFLSVLPIHHTYECTCGMLCPLYAGASVHYSRNLKTVVEDLQKVKATMLLGVPLLYDKMFKRIMKTINEDKLKSKIVPPLMKLSNFLQKAGSKDIKKKIFAELHKKFGGHIRVF
ncbi:MAG: long-chain fatty acid--CoA ligase, partial [Ignavibacteria bacterium]